MPLLDFAAWWSPCSSGHPPITARPPSRTGRSLSSFASPIPSPGAECHMVLCVTAWRRQSLPVFVGCWFYDRPQDFHALYIPFVPSIDCILLLPSSHHYNTNINTTHTSSHSSLNTHIIIIIITMRLDMQTLNLSYGDPQPRDGGAPHPGARPRQSSAMLCFMAGDGPQPRDGG